MTPQFSVGVFSQRDFRGVGPGPLDDCWIMADQMCVLGCAPWVLLRSVKPYRDAAGVFDTATGAEGGSLEDSKRAINALWPELAVELYRGTWTGFLAKAKASRRPVSGSVWSRALGYSTDFKHRVAFYFNGTVWGMLDPLRPAFENRKEVTEAFIKKAFADYPDTAEVNCLLFPTVEEAFKTHPLYATQDASEQQLAAARAAGFTQGKVKATEAVQSITL